MNFLFAMVLGSTPTPVKYPPIQPVATAQYRIAIIDSGYDPSRAQVPLKLCKTGHYDYFTETPNLNYIDDHGTQVADLIAEKLKDVDYCAIIIQLFRGVDHRHLHTDFVDAFKRADAAGAMAINVSLSSNDDVYEGEETVLRTLSKKKIALFIAAGNERKYLDAKCTNYPECYHFRDMIVVGAQDYMNPNQHAGYSNYGPLIDIWAPGYYERADGMVNQGTSYAAPRALAEWILFLSKKKKH